MGSFELCPYGKGNETHAYTGVLLLISAD